MKTKQIKTIAFMLLIVVFMAVSCNTADNYTSSASTDSTAVNKLSSTTTRKEEPLKGCYILVLKKDTLQLAITAVNGNSVEGSMILNFAEKDKSNGTFEGEYKNGILIGNYKFKSEGTSSEKQVIFKKVQNGFIEGFGRMTMVDEKEVFVKQNEVEFNQNNVFMYTENCLN